MRGHFMYLSDEAVEILDKKLEEMWKRLDGTYQINNGN